VRQDIRKNPILNSVSRHNEANMIISINSQHRTNKNNLKAPPKYA